jgi:cytochrome c
VGAKHWIRIFVAAGAAATAWLSASGAPGDPPPGRAVFEKRCSGCHALDHVKSAPPLAGVFGRRAASSPDFPYSDALRKAQFAWDETRLDRWLTDPDSLVPANDMAFRLSNAGERAAVIAYLKQLPGK